MSSAIPPNVIKWIASFLSGQTQAVSSDEKLSCWLTIMQSIVQGIGPFPCIIFASDLKLLSQPNQLCKYADDTTLPIPQNTKVSVEDEFNRVLQWSTQNKLSVFIKPKN
jgi:Reverse transcriptase (RNA-dependent DNA polymerase)